MKKGDKVKLRGRKPAGVVKSLCKNPDWLRVDWNIVPGGAEIVHIKEVELIEGEDNG